MTKSTIPVTITPPADPTTLEEWQNAVNAAQALLAIESARAYGLITGGPAANVDRCEDLLDRGRSLGIVPSADAVERWVGGLCGDGAKLSVGSPRPTSGGGK